MLYILIAIGLITIYTTFFGGDTKNEYCFKVSTDELGPNGEPTIIGYSTQKCTAATALQVTNEMMKQSPHLKIVCTNVQTGEVLISNRPIQKGTQYAMAGILFCVLFIAGCAEQNPPPSKKIAEYYPTFVGYETATVCLGLDCQDCPPDYFDCFVCPNCPVRMDRYGEKWIIDSMDVAWRYDPAVIDNSQMRANQIRQIEDMRRENQKNNSNQTKYIDSLEATIL